MEHHRELVFTGVLLLANRMQTVYDQELGELTLKQWLVLAVLANLPQPAPSAAVVAEALGTSHQNTSKLLSALEKKGFVSFSPSPDDARARQISLTPHALSHLAANASLGETLLGRLLTGIPDDDVATCFRVLEAMSLNLTGTPLAPKEL